MRSAALAVKAGATLDSHSEEVFGLRTREEPIIGHGLLQGIAREHDCPFSCVLRRSRYNLVAGLDIHKKTVVVIVLQSAQPDQDYASGTFGTTQFGLKELAAFLRQHGVTQVAMESTAQYWRPVWMTLEENSH